MTTVTRTVAFLAILGMAVFGSPTALLAQSVADAGPDQTHSCVAAAGMSITLDGTASFSDPADPITSYTWTEGASTLGTGATLSVTLLPGVHTITLTVGTFNGRSSSDNVLMTLNAAVPPTITAPPAVSQVNDFRECGAADTSVALGAPTFTGGCGPVTVTNDAPALFPVGTTTVTWTATDSVGGTAIATQLVTITDTEKPRFRAPDSLTVSTEAGLCGRDLSTIALGWPTNIRDNCGIDTTYYLDPNFGTFLPAGQWTRIRWRVRDIHGNIGSRPQWVFVQDTEPPTLTAPAAITQDNDAGLCGADAASLTLGTPSVTDNCEVDTVYNDAPAFFPVGTTTVTWTAVDTVGNTATATQDVTINDVENPTITAPAAITQANDAGLCGADAASVMLGTPATADNCAVDTVYNDAPAIFPVGTTTVTWTVMDIHGNTATATQDVTINDLEDPTITAPAAIVQGNDAGFCGADAMNVALGMPMTDDNCAVDTVYSDAPGFFPVGTTTVTWTVMDIHGNTATATQDVTIDDIEPPTITAPAAVTQGNDPGLCGADAASVMLGTPVVADNCPGVTYMNNAPAFFPVGTTSVEWTATDAYGNQATAMQDVTINDIEPPTITPPADITQNNDLGVCGARVDVGVPVTGDNCPGETYTNDAPGFFPVGTTTVTWTVTDAHGNQTTATQLVTVLDVEPPSITAPVSLTLPNDPGECHRARANTNLGTPVTADNCGVDTVYNNAPMIFVVGTTPVTWTVVDIHGNSSTAMQTVTIEDVEPPTIQVPQDVTVASDSWQCGTSNVYLGTPQVDDNCGVAQYYNNAPAFYPLGTTYVVWTVEDIHGNITTATQTVIVEDRTPPSMWVILFPNFLTPANQSMRTIRAYVNVTDNCGKVNWVLESVTSSQPDANTWPKDIPGDIVATTGAPTTSFALRAESTPGAASRGYTVRYRAIDGSGNSQLYQNIVVVMGTMFKDELIVSDETVIPESIELSTNFPNPFSERTSITFRLPSEMQATLRVYDALGREVAVLVDGLYGAGSHALEFNGGDLPEGTYLYRLDAGNTVQTKKMVIVR